MTHKRFIWLGKLFRLALLNRKDETCGSLPQEACLVKDSELKCQFSCYFNLTAFLPKDIVTEKQTINPLFFDYFLGFALYFHLLILKKNIFFFEHANCVTNSEIQDGILVLFKSCFNGKC